MSDEWSGLPGDPEPERRTPAWIPKMLGWSAFGMVLSLGLCGVSALGNGSSNASAYWMLPGWAGLLGFLACLLGTLVAGLLVIVNLILGRR